MAHSAAQIFDELLVLRCGKGDPEAFAALVENHQPRLFAHAMQLTGRRDVALDMVQDTWLALIRGLPKLRDPANFAGYAHRVLARRCVDWTRRQQRQRRVDLALTAEALVRVGLPQANAETASDAVRIREALDRLAPDRRVTMVLHYLQDLPVARIASLLRIPAGTVKSRLHAARGELKRALDRRNDPCPK